MQEADKVRAELRAMCDENGWDAGTVAADFLKLYDVEVKVASAKLLREFIALKRAEVAA